MNFIKFLPIRLQPAKVKVPVSVVDPERSGRLDATRHGPGRKEGTRHSQHRVKISVWLCGILVYIRQLRSERGELGGEL